MSYVAHTDADRQAMLETIGVESISDLFNALPDRIRLTRDLAIPPALDEMALVRHLHGISGKNKNLDEYLCFLGAGIYDHFAPAVVDMLASRGEFATSYTPYQPEVSQGMLQAIYEFQSLICRLTGMDMANASMYDAATSLAEAALMAVDITGRKKVLIARSVHPHYRRVVETYIRTSGFHLVELDHEDGTVDMDALTRQLDKETACVLIQHPNFFGNLEDIAAFQKAVASVGALSVVSVDPIALGLLKPPGEFGVDVVVGEGQSLGCAMGYGGPLLGFFACKYDYQRKFPGRIVGATTDAEGRRGYTMTLRTREQDIRREKATSNICTNEALLALAATVYLCELGKSGLRQVADLCLQKAYYAATQLSALEGVEVRYKRPFFKEFVVRLPLGVRPQQVNRRLLDQGIIGGYDLGRSYDDLRDSILLCVTETKTKSDIDRLTAAFADATRLQEVQD